MIGGMICPPVEAAASIAPAVLRPVADLLHQRDGQRAGGHHIAGGCAVDHAHQAGGEDRHLGRSAAGAASGGKGEVDEIVADLGGLQEGRKDDEQDDVGRRHRRRRPEDTRIGIDMAEEPLPGDGGRIQKARQHAARQTHKSGRSIGNGDQCKAGRPGASVP
jgi:hypothetical protein